MSDSLYLLSVLTLGVCFAALIVLFVMLAINTIQKNKSKHGKKVNIIHSANAKSLVHHG